MHAIFQQGHPEAPVLVLLHGTGGDEHSLLEVGKTLNKQASLLSIRGNVLENGMPRFFRRLAEGVYDEADLAARGAELNTFIREAAEKYQFSLSNVVLVGYSNGANIAIQLLLSDPTFQQAILFHPMYPVENIPTQSLPETRVFMSLGTHDPIVPVAESQHVIQLFEDRQASVTTLWTRSHQLTYEEVQQAQEWLHA